MPNKCRIYTQFLLICNYAWQIQDLFSVCFELLETNQINELNILQLRNLSLIHSKSFNASSSSTVTSISSWNTFIAAIHWQDKLTYNIMRYNSYRLSFVFLPALISFVFFSTLISFVFILWIRLLFWFCWSYFCWLCTFIICL